MKITGTWVDGKPIKLKNIVYMTPLIFAGEDECRIAGLGKDG